MRDWMVATDMTRLSSTVASGRLMLRCGERAKPPRRVRLEREADRRPVEFVERLPRAAQIVAGDGRRALHDVEGGRAGSTALGFARQNLEVRRQRVVVGEQRRLAAGERALIDQRQSQLRGRLDDLLGAIDVGHARQLAPGSDRRPCSAGSPIR